MSWVVAKGHWHKRVDKGPVGIDRTVFPPRILRGGHMTGCGVQTGGEEWPEPIDAQPHCSDPRCQSSS